ncbi:hypothetical protein HanPI659440_Chr05g0183871 [Helianthus annuus]|nr:hypothetical protein HanPI659440_Chr05g0183871 [Helianthus annuus]
MKSGHWNPGFRRRLTAGHTTLYLSHFSPGRNKPGSSQPPSELRPGDTLEHPHPYNHHTLISPLEDRRSHDSGGDENRRWWCYCSSSGCSVQDVSPSQECKLVSDHMVQWVRSSVNSVRCRVNFRVLWVGLV